MIVWNPLVTLPWLEIEAFNFDRQPSPFIFTRWMVIIDAQHLFSHCDILAVHIAVHVCLHSHPPPLPAQRVLQSFKKCRRWARFRVSAKWYVKRWEFCFWDCVMHGTLWACYRLLSLDLQSSINGCCKRKCTGFRSISSSSTSKIALLNSMFVWICFAFYLHDGLHGFNALVRFQSANPRTDCLFTLSQQTGMRFHWINCSSIWEDKQFTSAFIVKSTRKHCGLRCETECGVVCKRNVRVVALENRFSVIGWDFWRWTMCLLHSNDCGHWFFFASPNLCRLRLLNTKAGQTLDMTGIIIWIHQLWSGDNHLCYRWPSFTPSQNPSTCVRLNRFVFDLTVLHPGWVTVWIEHCSRRPSRRNHSRSALPPQSMCKSFR